jgi:hypothetical protein
LSWEVRKGEMIAVIKKSDRKAMNKCPLCGIDLNVDYIDLKSHLSDRHGNRVEVAKALANILERLEQIERNIEKSHGPID